MMNITLERFRGRINAFYIMKDSEKCGTIIVKEVLDYQSSVDTHLSVDISIYKHKQRQGIGTEALKIIQGMYERPLYATIRQSNTPSIKAFISAGFILVGKDKNGQLLYRSTN